MTSASMSAASATDAGAAAWGGASRSVVAGSDSWASSSSCSSSFGGGAGGAGGGFDLTQLAPGTVTGGAPGESQQELAERCNTEGAIDEYDDCYLIKVYNETDEVWAEELPNRGAEYRAPGLTFFTQAVNTGCGQASSQVGPFYCPPDENIYIDIEFLEQRVTIRRGRPVRAAYIMAHEFGHHLQTILGVEPQVQQALAVRSGTRERPVGPAGAASRLLRRRLGPTRRRARQRDHHPRRVDAGTGGGGRASVTTGSRRPPPGGSTRSRSPTGRRSSVSSGTQPASRPATSRPATPLPDLAVALSPRSARGVA